VRILEKSISSARAACLASFLVLTGAPVLAQYQNSNGWAPANEPVSFNSNAMVVPSNNFAFPSAQLMPATAPMMPAAPMMPTAPMMQASPIMPTAQMMAPFFGNMVPQNVPLPWERRLPSRQAYANQVQSQNTANNNAILSYNKGIKQLESEHYEHAITDFLTALNANPHFTAVHSSLGQAYYELADFRNAISEFELALQFAPQDSQSCFFAGMSAIRLRDYNHANAMFNRYLTLNSIGERADKARKIIEILDRNYFRPVSGDYLADVTSLSYERWQNSGRPITVYVNDGSSTPGFRPEYDPILRRAFHEWANASCGKVAFEFVTSAAAAQITCSWTDKRENLTSYTELGFTRTSVANNGAIASAHIDLFVFSKDKKTPTCELSSQARNVDLHEIGHALGFAHSGFLFDIMAPVSFPLGLEFPLSARDANTINAFYSAPEQLIANSTAGASGGNSGASESVAQDSASFQTSGINSAQAQNGKTHLGLSRKLDLWKTVEE